MIAGQVDGNDAIAAIFDDIADLLELEDANPFRIRAYRNAARTLRAFTGEIVTWGDGALHQQLRATLPHGLAQLPIAVAGDEAQLKTLACLLPEYDDRQSHVAQKVTAWRTCDSLRPFS